MITEDILSELVCLSGLQYIGNFLLHLVAVAKQAYMAYKSRLNIIAKVY